MDWHTVPDQSYELRKGEEEVATLFWDKGKQEWFILSLSMHFATDIELPKHEVEKAKMAAMECLMEHCYTKATIWEEKAKELEEWVHER